MKGFIKMRLVEMHKTTTTDKFDKWVGNLHQVYLAI